MKIYFSGKSFTNLTWTFLPLFSEPFVYYYNLNYNTIGKAPSTHQVSVVTYMFGFLVSFILLWSTVKVEFFDWKKTLLIHRLQLGNEVYTKIRLNINNLLTFSLFFMFCLIIFSTRVLIHMYTIHPLITTQRNALKNVCLSFIWFIVFSNLN